MSWQDLVSAQISNVCITRHAALNALACVVCVKQFAMLLLAISHYTKSSHLTGPPCSVQV